MRSLLSLSLAALSLLACPAAARAAQDPTHAARAIASQTMTLQDKNHDGRISLKESAGAALTLFGSIDTDRSRLISASEMMTTAMNDVAALKISSSADQTAAMVQARFAIMDIDGDGTISLPEMLAVTETVFNAADTDADGFVSENELAVLALTRTASEEAR